MTPEEQVMRNGCVIIIRSNAHWVFSRFNVVYLWMDADGCFGSDLCVALNAFACVTHVNIRPCVQRSHEVTWASLVSSHLFFALISSLLFSFALISSHLVSSVSLFLASSSVFFGSYLVFLLVLLCSLLVSFALIFSLFISSFFGSHFF